MSMFSLGGSKKNKNSTANAITSIVSTVLVIILLIYLVKSGEFDDLLSLVSLNTESNEMINDFEGSSLVVRYLDVGQTDSILIQMPNGENMLIDAGNSETVSYLEDYKIDTIDYMVMTHPHADHISGMASVIENFTVKNIYMPVIDSDSIPTTKVFTNFLKAAKKNKAAVNEIKAGKTLFEYNGLKAETLAPNGHGYSDLNDYSIVVRLQYANNVFIFSGDAEEISEKEILSAYDADYLKADVLQCGHHGSNSSSSAAYLAVVKPEYAVISCGKDNKYGHPTPETLKRLKDIKAKVYRTDLNGTVTCTSDGTEITFSVEKGSVSR